METNQSADIIVHVPAAQLSLSSDAATQTTLLDQFPTEKDDEKEQWQENVLFILVQYKSFDTHLHIDNMQISVDLGGEV